MSPTDLDPASELTTLKTTQDFDGFLLKKHLAVVQIAGGISGLARKFFNVLLGNAFDDLLENTENNIQLSVLFEVAGYNSRNYEAAFSALTELQTTLAVFDVEGGSMVKDSWFKNFRSGQLLGEYEVENGVLNYSFPPKLSKSLHDPEIYQIIDLTQQRKIPSASSAFPLWENLLPYITHSKDGKGTTGFKLVSFWKKVLGSEAKTYNQFKFFRSKVLRPNLDRIEEGINYTFAIRVQKNGRVITHVAIDFEENSQQKLFTTPLPVVKNYPEYEELKSNNVAKVQAMSWLQEYGQDYIREKLDLLEKTKEKKAIKNAGGWLRTAIDRDYKDSEKQKKEEQQKLKLEKKEEDKIEQASKALASKKLDLSKKFWEIKTTEFIKNMPQKDQEDFLEKLRSENPMMNNLIKSMSDTFVTAKLVKIIPNYEAEKEKYIADNL